MLILASHAFKILKTMNFHRGIDLAKVVGAELLDSLAVGDGQCRHSTKPRQSGRTEPTCAS